MTREAKLDGLALAGGEQLCAGEAVKQPDRLRTGGVGPGDINLHGLRGGQVSPMFSTSALTVTSVPSSPTLTLPSAHVP